MSDRAQFIVRYSILIVFTTSYLVACGVDLTERGASTSDTVCLADNCPEMCPEDCGQNAHCDLSNEQGGRCECNPGFVPETDGCIAEEEEEEEDFECSDRPSIVNLETCADGIQNSDEDGIDCGGQCTLDCDQLDICNENMGIPFEDCHALVALYWGTGGRQWDRESNWTRNAVPCNWYGIQCNQQQNRVSGISLSHNNLSGYLPPEIAKLTRLDTFEIDGNEIQGIGSGLFNLPRLERLDVSFNDLCEISEQLGNAQALEYLNLERTRLRSLPSTIVQLSALKRLILSMNPINELPADIGNLNKLTGLHLFDCSLNDLPVSMTELTELVFLALGRNNLEEIGFDIENLQVLESLDIGRNRLQQFPEQILNLENLWYLTLSSNRLVSLPDTLDRLSQLRTARLDNNLITMEIPERWRQSLNHIETIDLTCNTNMSAENETVEEWLNDFRPRESDDWAQNEGCW